MGSRYRRAVSIYSFINFHRTLRCPVCVIMKNNIVKDRESRLAMEQIRIEVKSGQTLWQAMKEKGIGIERPCGGNGLCRGCMVQVEGKGMVRSCQFSEAGTYEVQLPESGICSFDVVDGQETKAEAEKLLEYEKPVAVVDIGTTTVALKLFWNKQVQTASFVNPQRQFGADVMSRIQAANHGALLEMQQLLQNRVYQELMELLDKSGYFEEEQKVWRVRLVIAANTTMMHIYRGLSCEGLGKAPFSPVTLEFGQRIVEKRLDIQKVVDNRRLEVEEIYLPGISTFVGADIVSGIYALDICKEDKPVLLLDLGTNGEMALGCKHKLLVASAAAGPAFEGSPLAMQIHASGIMRVFHKLIRCKNIDEYGTLVDKYFKEGYPIDNGIRLTQEDIREIQMAKAAIRAGIEMLLGAYGITAQEVEKVYLAGGMGYYLDAEDAAAMGLLPEVFVQQNKVQSVGNTSLKGIVRYLEEGEDNAKDELLRIKNLAKEIVLSKAGRFQTLYLEHMNFKI